ncbi:MAG: hypothetical protein WCO07_02860 [bacterium]
MQEITLEEIQKKFDSLPENLRLAIIVAGVDKKVNTIGREHGLNIRQISELLLKTHIMMFGFIHPDQFEESLKDINQIPLESIKGIVRDVNEQILKDIRDELIDLAEKPRATEEVESFIQESTLLEKPEESPVVSVETKQISVEEKQNTAILKSAGIEITPLISEEEIKTETPAIEKTPTEIKTEKAQEETPHESIYAQSIPNSERQKPTTPPVPTQEDKNNTAILKSAGIEITPLAFGNEIVEKTEIIPVKKEEEKVETRENEEVMKIAFENLPKIDAIPLETKKEESPVEKIPTPPHIEKPQTETKEKKEIKIPTPPPLELEPGKTPQEIPLSVIPPVKIKPIDIPLVKTEAIKPATVEAPTTTIKTEEKKKEEPKEEKTAEKPTKKLKLAVSNIIASYKAKTESVSSSAYPLYSIKSAPKTQQEGEELNYENPEEKKRLIVMEIVEVQDNIKIIKDRLLEIEKEKARLEKEKKELSKKDQVDSISISAINTELNEMLVEEKIIQKLREADLPKEYLDLLEKLDKMSAHKSTKDTHK